MIGYVDNKVSTANIGMKGYVDSVATLSIYGNANVASYLTTYSGNITAGNVTTTSIVKTGVYTVSNLPGASAVGAGARAFVTDANTITFGSAISGGAGNAMPVFSNGTTWLIG